MTLRIASSLGVLFLSMAWVSPSSAQALRFATADQLSTRGLGHQAVATADLNADSRADLVLNNNTGLAVLLGVAGGGLARPIAYAAGGQTYGLVLGDFNGDGRIDAAELREGPAAVIQLVIFKGTGTGSFQAPVIYATGLSPVYLAAGDFNGDGRIDIVTGSHNSGKVSVQLNLGGGLFSLPHDHFVGQSLAGIAAADLNHDGKTDVVVAHSYVISSSETVLLSDGAGGFVAAAGAISLVGSRAPTLVDLDNDTHVDIVAPYLDGNEVRVFLGVGDGSFAPPSTIAAPGAPSRVAVGDVDRDGRLDLVTSDFSGNSTSVLLANGDGTFRAHGTYGASTGPTGLVLVDLDGDQYLDAVVSNGNAPEISVQRGLGDGTLHGVPISHLGGWVYTVSPGDFNADGRVDLAAVAPGAADVLFTGTDGRFASPVSIGPGGTWVVAGDFDGDGLRDLATGDSATGQVAVALGTGTESFATATSFALGLGPARGAAVDLDGDGFDDLIVPRQDANDVAVVMATGGGGFAAPIFYPVGTYPVAAGAGDFDGDGLVDIVVANQYSNSVAVLPAHGGGGFGPAVFLPTGLAPFALAVADLDGNGRMDLAVVNINSGTVSIFLGTAKGLKAFRRYRAGTYPGDIAVGDLDGDRRLDLAVVDLYSRHVLILRGLGSGTLTKPVSLPAGGGAVAIADYDGDHRLDLAVSNLNDLWQFRNLTPMADLSVTVDDGVTTVLPGAGTTYLMQVTNRGPEPVPDALVSLQWSPSLAGATWTCAATGGTSCPSGGTRAIAQRIPIEVGATLTFTLTAPALARGATCATVTAAASSRTLRDQGAGNDRAVDTDGVAPGIAIGPTRTVEPTSGSRSLRFLVTLDRATCREVRVGYFTSDGTATSGQDYDAVAGTLIFPPGTLRQWITVPVRGDALAEGDETVLLNLQDPVEATLSTPQAVGTILDSVP